ncbi:MAG: hypothetical protein JJ863_19115 [Deltaproteobacteria bacterium]|nr:hypothetical protein [Deltaproteobacteria bacterium]
MRSFLATAASLLVLLASGGCGSRTALSLGDPPEGADLGSPPSFPPDLPFPLDGGTDGAIVWPPDGAVPASCEASDVVLRYSAGTTSAGPFDLRATIQVPMVDVYFLIDTTGSMSGELGALHAAFLEVVANAHCPSDGARCSENADCPGEACAGNGRCAPTAVAESCLADPQVGIGRYAGEPGSFFHLADIGPATEATAEAFPPIADGWGHHETMFQAMFCSFSEPGECPNDCATDGLLCPGFRPGAVPLYVTISDEGDQCPYCGPDEVSVGAQARELGAILVGIDTADTPREATAQFVRLAEESGSFDADGNPLVFAGREGEVVDAVRAGLAAAAQSPLPLRVDLVGEGIDPDAVIASVRLDRSSEGCFPYRGTTDRDGDGFADGVPAAGRGTTACFTVEPRDRVAVSGPTMHRVSAILRHGELEADRLDLCVVID